MRSTLFTLAACQSFTIIASKGDLDTTKKHMFTAVYNSPANKPNLLGKNRPKCLNKSWWDLPLVLTGGVGGKKALQIYC